MLSGIQLFVMIMWKASRESASFPREVAMDTIMPARGPSGPEPARLRRPVLFQAVAQTEEKTHDKSHGNGRNQGTLAHAPQLAELDEGKQHGQEHERGVEKRFRDSEVPTQDG